MKTHRTGGGIFGVHFGSELGINLGTPVNGAGRGTMGDNGNDVEGDRAHIEEHARDVDERSKEEDALAPEED